MSSLHLLTHLYLLCCPAMQHQCKTVCTGNTSIIQTTDNLLSACYLLSTTNQIT
ncbi:hypothetical protein BofuT4_uP016890.1 [Botrytis cinerea T4]|uniref:Uncharacterized protein n=1 Tax=Botryotinia fuckeliana (strain T4) TaxID=999810 RepID=G2YI46_BOTF4|nr:hypothetical protein BofuT4_uP016890.1 [Botrytis cinerea T4]